MGTPAVGHGDEANPSGPGEGSTPQLDITTPLTAIFPILGDQTPPASIGTTTGATTGKNEDAVLLSLQEYLKAKIDLKEDALKSLEEFLRIKKELEEKYQELEKKMLPLVEHMQHLANAWAQVQASHRP